MPAGKLNIYAQHSSEADDFLLPVFELQCRLAHATLWSASIGRCRARVALVDAELDANGSRRCGAYRRGLPDRPRAVWKMRARGFIV